MHARRARPSCVTQPGRDADTQKDVDLVLELESPFTFYHLSIKNLALLSATLNENLILLMSVRTQHEPYRVYLYLSCAKYRHKQDLHEIIFQHINVPNAVRKL